MRKTSVENKFFTEDLYLDFGETGNAFWGYHIANNFSRLLSIGGTAYFKEGPVPQDGGVLKNWVSVDIPIGNYQFQAAPIVQLWSTEPNYVLSTLLTVATFSGGSLQNAFPIPTSNSVYFYHSIWTDFGNYSPLAPVVGEDYLKIGSSSSEVMAINGFTQNRNDAGFGHSPRYQWERRYLVSRESLETTAEAYSEGDSVYHVGSVGTTGDGLTWPTSDKSWGQELSITGSSIRHQPSWVEAYFDAGKLRIRWLKVSNNFFSQPTVKAGTVYFRIFGV